LSPCPLRGWFVITARRHVEDVGELTTDEASELGVLVSKISAAVTDALRPARVHVFSHGEMVPHVHVHVLPRYDGMPPSGLEALLAIRNGEWRCSDQDAADTAAAVRAALA